MHVQVIYTISTGEKITCMAEECANEMDAVNDEIDYQESAEILLIESIDNLRITIRPEYIVMTEYRFFIGR